MMMSSEVLELSSSTGILFCFGSALVGCDPLTGEHVGLPIWDGKVEYDVLEDVIRKFSSSSASSLLSTSSSLSKIPQKEEEEDDDDEDLALRIGNTSLIGSGTGNSDVVENVFMDYRVATVDNLISMITKASHYMKNILHLSLIGGMDYLAFEDELGYLHPVNSKTLMEILNPSNRGCNLSLLILSSTYPEKGLEMFANLGIPYAVGILRDSGTSILPKVISTFLQSFYYALFDGNTIPSAFEIASLEANNKDSALFFLRQYASSIQAPFPLFSKDRKKQNGLRFSKVHRPCMKNFAPNPDPVFIGRTLMMSNIYTCIARRANPYPCAVITGYQGCGKTQLALRVCSYAIERNAFEKIFYFDCRDSKYFLDSLTGSALAIATCIGCDHHSKINEQKMLKPLTKQEDSNRAYLILDIIRESLATDRQHRYLMLIDGCETQISKLSNNSTGVVTKSLRQNRSSFFLLTLSTFLKRVTNVSIICTSKLNVKFDPRILTHTVEIHPLSLISSLICFEQKARNFGLLSSSLEEIIKSFENGSSSILPSKGQQDLFQYAFYLVRRFEAVLELDHLVRIGILSSETKSIFLLMIEKLPYNTLLIDVLMHGVPVLIDDSIRIIQQDPNNLKSTYHAKMLECKQRFVSNAGKELFASSLSNHSENIPVKVLDRKVQKTKDVITILRLLHELEENGISLPSLPAVDFWLCCSEYDSNPIDCERVSLKSFHILLNQSLIKCGVQRTLSLEELLFIVQSDKRSPCVEESFVDARRYITLFWPWWIGILEMLRLDDIQSLWERKSTVEGGSYIFDGFMSRDASIKKLSNSQKGTFILRFSESNIRSFAIDYRGDMEVFSVLLRFHTEIQQYSLKVGQIEKRFEKLADVFYAQEVTNLCRFLYPNVSKSDLFPNSSITT